MNFHHIGITTKDINKSIKFYTEVLGFKETKSWGEGENKIVMVESDGGACLELFANGVSELPEGAFKHLAFRVDDTRKIFEKVKNAGMEIIKEPTEIIIQSTPPTPVTLAFFKGPDGKVLELFQER